MEALSLWGCGIWKRGPHGCQTADEKSEVCTPALKCFSLEGTHVTFTYNLSARISHMVLCDCKGSGQCGEGGSLVVCTEITVIVTQWWKEGGNDHLSEEVNEVKSE